MKYLKYKGRRMCIAHWAREIGLQPPSLQYRLDAGWSIKRALTAPKAPGRWRDAKPDVTKHRLLASIQARIAKNHAELTENLQREMRIFLNSFADALHSKTTIL